MNTNIEATTIKSFWENNTFTPEIALTAKKVKKMAEDEIRTLSKMTGDKTFDKFKDKYDKLAYLSNKYIKENGKNLDRTYTVVFKVDSLARFCPRSIEMILPVLFQQYSPDFSYNCKVVFDDKPALEDFMVIKDDVEKLASYQSFVNKVEFNLNKRRY